jgi:hypothetical protein
MKQNVVLFWIAAHATVLSAQSPGTFTATGNMVTERNGHTATLLNNGKVLIAGGNANSSTPLGLASAELYDPSTGTFAVTANMTAARVWHTATLLNDGKVLIAGGQNRDGALASAELYDPSAETFTPTGKMAVVRSGQFATLLSNGKVLIAQHLDGSGDRTEVYDPDTGVFSDTAGWKNSVDINGVSEYVGAATVNSLTNGKILVTLEPQGCVFPVPNAYLYDPAIGTFISTDPPVYGLCEPTSTLLSDGTLLLTGGQFDSAGLSQLYDPASGNFSRSGDLTTHRGGHTATLLSDGAVLVSGGFQFVGNPLDLSGYHAVILASAEVYHPAVSMPAPALFSLSGDGKGQGAIWHATGQIASPSDPAVAGEALSMYTTSLAGGGVIPPAGGNWWLACRGLVFRRCARVSRIQPGRRPGAGRRSPGSGCSGASAVHWSSQQRSYHRATVIPLQMSSRA